MKWTENESRMHPIIAAIAGSMTIAAKIKPRKLRADILFIHVNVSAKVSVNLNCFLSEVFDRV